MAFLQRPSYSLLRWRPPGTTASLFFAFLLLKGTGAAAAPPQLYHQAAYQSPVHGAPDDLLLLAGSGLAANDTVVYRAVQDTTAPLAVPEGVPDRSGPAAGVAPIVSAADAPRSLTVRLPQAMTVEQSYALWVRNGGGEWSRGVLINDARPLWVSPAYVYDAGMPASLPRQIKIVGRNLAPTRGHSTWVRLVGPRSYTASAMAEDGAGTVLGAYVARVELPERLQPGRYELSISRDGRSWVKLPAQTLQVIPGPPSSIPEFAVDDPRFGGCHPDDGIDDAECIVRAVAAAKIAGGGIVRFRAGTWDLIESGQPGMVDTEGIVLPAGVQLRGAGSERTRLARHGVWNGHGATAAFTLVGHNVLSGFTFNDLGLHQLGEHSGPYLQLGEEWRRAVAAAGASWAKLAVRDITITHNTFDKPDVAIAAGGLPIELLFITYNTFGAFSSGLELSSDYYDMTLKYRLDDSVIDYNVFKPGSKLDITQKSGAVAGEIGAGLRVDFSGNEADGTSGDYLNTPSDAKGWNAAFFWNLSGNVEQVLVSHNLATCTADKIGDGQAIGFDNNTNTFAFARAATVAAAGQGSVTVSAPLLARQRNRDVALQDYYIGHWLQIVSGPGTGQVRKIVGYTTSPATRSTTFKVSPDWDVLPAANDSRVTIGREYWQVYVLENTVDNREPLCQKSNRSRRVGGAIGLWAQSADFVFAGNTQYDSDGIGLQQNYETPEHDCADCSMVGYFTFFVEISNNVVDGEYDWSNDCSRSGIVAGVAAAPWDAGPPPTVGFGVTIAHNRIRRADAQYGGAIAQVNTWYDGPAPHRWPLSSSMLIHHNAIVDIDGPSALPVCGGSRPRIGIAFPDPAIAWRTVLYANSCKNVSHPLGAGGIDTVKVCPSSAPDSCECPPPR